MRGFADADLVTAIVKDSDHLKRRAEAQLLGQTFHVPFSVGIELLFVARKLGTSCVAFIGSAMQHFDVERSTVLLAAAQALDKGGVTTVFDAVHGAQALVSGTKLHTTDRRLLGSRFPTEPF